MGRIRDTLQRLRLKPQDVKPTLLKAARAADAVTIEERVDDVLFKPDGELRNKAEIDQLLQEHEALDLESKREMLEAISEAEQEMQKDGSDTTLHAASTPTSVHESVEDDTPDAPRDQQKHALNAARRSSDHDVEAKSLLDAVARLAAQIDDLQKTMQHTAESQERKLCAQTATVANIEHAAIAQRTALDDLNRQQLLARQEHTTAINRVIEWQERGSRAQIAEEACQKLLALDDVTRDCVAQHYDDLLNPRHPSDRKNAFENAQRSVLGVEAGPKLGKGGQGTVRRLVRGYLQKEQLLLNPTHSDLARRNQAVVVEVYAMMLCKDLPGACQITNVGAAPAFDITLLCPDGTRKILTCVGWEATQRFLSRLEGANSALRIVSKHYLGNMGIITMEEGYCSVAGMTLKKHIMAEQGSQEQVAERQQWKVKLGWALTRQTADALAAIHQRGILHRDLKPDNMLVCPPASSVTGVQPLPRAIADLPLYAFKIIDFGLAVILPPGETTARGCCGTPLFAAPEQMPASGERPANAPRYYASEKSDVWSWGLSMQWAWVTLRACQTDPSLPSKLPMTSQQLKSKTRCPAKLCAVLARSTAKQPQDRPNMQQICTAMQTM